MVPLIERRFIVGWDFLPNNRQLVFVFDKLSGRVVYKSNCIDRKRDYPHIQRFYGKDNCIPPKQLNLRIFE